jgi:hypothetical protein
MRLAPTPRKALASLVWHRLLVSLRGLRFQQRDGGVIPEAKLLRIDACWSVSLGLGTVDTIRATDYQSRHLLLALAAGEPYRIARALALEVGFTAIPGRPSERRARRISATAIELARQIAHPHALGLATFSAGALEYFMGRWRASVAFLDKAETILADQCTNVSWETASCQRFALASLFCLGEMGEIRRRLPEAMRGARERGNLYAFSVGVRYSPLIHLADDSPESARRDLKEIIGEWSQKEFHIQHYSAYFSRIQIALYSADYQEAWTVLEEGWKPLRRSMILRMQVFRIEALHLRARCALGLVSAGDRNPELLRMAERQARRIRREGIDWGDPHADLIEAAVHHQRGERPAAVEALGRAVAGFEQVEMRLYAAASRRQLGVLVGGEQGRPLVADADEWMSGQQIRDPQRMAEMLAPGLNVAGARQLGLPPS